MIHFFVGQQEHFVNHLAPIYQAMPESTRGKFFVRAGSAAEKRAHWWQITPTRQRQFKPSEIVVVAGYEDYRATQKAKVVFYNHGVGQTYTGDPRVASMSSYSGGKNRDRTILFLCPSERDALVNRKAYPDIPAVAIGVPYLDQFSYLNRPPNGPVVISFHANIHACPETRWAWEWIRSEVVRLKQNVDFHLAAHCHPRAQRILVPWFRKIGIAYIPNWLDVLSQAQAYIIDNSSSGYEAAAIGIPTIWLNPPHYRRHVHHGLRFWDLIPGTQVDTPFDLQNAINLALQTVPNPDTRAYRGPNDESLVDGHATERAVGWLTSVCSTSVVTS